MPKSTHFQYKFDKQTGLSAVYDSAKMSIEEVPFNFRNYQLVLVDNLPANYKKQANEIYVKKVDKGLEISLLSTENQWESFCPLFTVLDLKPDCVLTQEAFDQKHSPSKNAKTLKENILKELFTLGYVVQPFNLKIYKITPHDPKEKSFLLACYHAKSGTNKSKDGPFRVMERKEINRISKGLQHLYPECAYLVLAEDSNEPAYVLKEGVLEGKNENDFLVYHSGLTQESEELAGDNLVLAEMGLPASIIEKERLVGCRRNAQTDKGGEKSNEKISAKARVMIFEFQTPPKNERHKNLPNAIATNTLLSKQSVPKGDVLTLQSGKTCGSDHSKTNVVEISGITIDVQPLLETYGPRGFISFESVYKEAPNEKTLKIEQASYLKLTELILLEMGKTRQEIQDMDFKAREKIIHPDRKQKNVPSNALVDELTTDWDKKKPYPKLYSILKEWIESPEQRAANDLLKKTPELQTEADIPKIFSAYFEKRGGDGRILDAVARAEKCELSGGYEYLPSPRQSQLESYTSMVGTVDLRIAAGDGPKNHDNYEQDMSKVCARLNILKAQTYKLDVAYLFLCGVLGGALAVSIATALIATSSLAISLSLASAAFIFLALAYTQPRIIRTTASSSSALPSATAAIQPTPLAGPRPVQESKPAIIFSNLKTSQKASNDSKVDTSQPEVHRNTA